MIRHFNTLQCDNNPILFFSGGDKIQSAVVACFVITISCFWKTWYPFTSYGSYCFFGVIVILVVKAGVRDDDVCEFMHIHVYLHMGTKRRKYTFCIFYKQSNYPCFLWWIVILISLNYNLLWWPVTHEREIRMHFSTIILENVWGLSLFLQCLSCQFSMRQLKP